MSEHGSPCATVLELQKNLAMLSTNVAELSAKVRGEFELTSLKHAQMNKELERNLQSFSELKTTLIQCVQQLGEGSEQLKVGNTRFECIEQRVDKIKTSLIHHEDGEGGKHDRDEKGHLYLWCGIIILTLAMIASGHVKDLLQAIDIVK